MVKKDPGLSIEDKFDEVRQLIINDAKPDEAIVNQLPTFAQLQTLLPDQTYIVSSSMSLKATPAVIR